MPHTKKVENAKKPTPELKAQAIAMFFAGHNPNYVAEELRLNVNTVWSWHREQGPLREQMRESQAELLGDKLFNLIVKMVDCADTMLNVIGDENYTRKQSAESLAILFGTTFDKALRLLEAYQRETQPANADADRAIPN